MVGRAGWRTVSFRAWDRSWQGRWPPGEFPEMSCARRRSTIAGARVESRHAKRVEVGVVIPTKDEIRAMLQHAGRLRPLLITVIFTGLRASELRGLTWA